MKFLQPLIKYCLGLFILAAAVGHAVSQESSGFPVLLGMETSPGDLENAAPRSVRFVTSLDFPPFNYLGPDGKLNGFNVYLAKSICSELQITATCSIQALPFTEMEQALARGQADAKIAGFASNAETRRTYLFSNAYIQLPARFILLKNAVDPDFAGGLEKVKIGTVAGAAHETMARAFFPLADVTGYASRELLLQDVKQGKIELAFGDAMSLLFWLSGRESAGCCRFAGGAYYSQIHLGEGMRIAVPTTRPDLVAAFNRALQSLQKSGRMEELYLRFFPAGFY